MSLKDAFAARREDTQLADILTWVNKQREIRELPPVERLPKGMRGQYTDCPIARAMNEGSEETVLVAAWGWWKKGSDHTHPVPECAKHFIRCFDSSKGFREYNA